MEVVALVVLSVQVVVLLVAAVVSGRELRRERAQWMAANERLVRAVLAKHAPEYGALERVAADSDIAAAVAHDEVMRERIVDKQPIGGGRRGASEARARASLRAVTRDTTPAQDEQSGRAQLRDLTAGADA